MRRVASAAATVPLAAMPFLLRRFSSAVSRRHYYDALGVTTDALQSEIKMAYFRAAKRLHPDVNPSVEAAEKFRAVTAAYDVLRDPASRAAYDMGAAQPEQAATARKERAKRASAYGRRGQHQSYQEWKAEVFRTVEDSAWRLVGVDDAGHYLRRMESKFVMATAAARAEPRNFEPARMWCREYRGWLAAGAVTCCLVTPAVPLILLFSAQCVKHADANAEQLLAWHARLRQRWQRPWSWARRRGG